MKIRFLVGGECPSPGIGEFKKDEEREISANAVPAAQTLILRGIAVEVPEVQAAPVAPKKTTQAPAPDKEA